MGGGIGRGCPVAALIAAPYPDAETLTLRDATPHPEASRPRSARRSATCSVALSHPETLAISHGAVPPLERLRASRELDPAWRADGARRVANGSRPRAFLWDLRASG